LLLPLRSPARYRSFRQVTLLPEAVATGEEVMEEVMSGLASMLGVILRAGSKEVATVVPLWAVFGADPAPVSGHSLIHCIALTF
jgi:hypothetical protein